MDSRLREAIKKNLHNRAENSKKRFARQETLEKRLKDEERLYRVLKNHPELLEKKMKRDARMKALRKAKDAEIRPKAEQRVEKPKKKLKSDPQLAKEGLVPKYDINEYKDDEDVLDALQNLETAYIVDSKTFRDYAKKMHPDRMIDHVNPHREADRYATESFADVLKYYDTAKKAHVPGFF